MGKVSGHKDEPVQRPVMQFRYVCHGCTKPAAYAVDTADVSFCTCQHCGKQQECRPENWIKLSEAEKAEMNQSYA